MYDILKVLLEYAEKYGGPFAVVAALLFLAVFLYHFYIRLPQKADLSGEVVHQETLRKTYLAFRERVGNGGVGTLGYEHMLRGVLRAVDQFFHDDPDATPSPTWTSDSMDRCLQLSLLYPVVSMFVVWWLTGVTGASEEAIGLMPGVSGTVRALSVLTTLAAVGAYYWLINPTARQKTFMWRVLRVTAFVVAFVFAGAVAVAVAGEVAVAIAGAFVVALAVALAGAVALSGALAGAFEGVFEGVFVFAVPVAVAVVIAVAGAVQSASLWLNDKRLGLGWWLYFPLLLSMGPVWMISAPHFLGIDGPPIWTPWLMLSGLPLLNALFDWISIGVTRKLLKAGLARPGWRPFAYAILDMLAAIALLFALLVVSLVFIHGLNLLAGSIGSEPTLDVTKTLETQPGDPSLWWIYITVFTTFVPSLANLVLGWLAGCAARNSPSQQMGSQLFAAGRPSHAHHQSPLLGLVPAHHPAVRRPCRRGFCGLASLHLGLSGARQGGLRPLDRRNLAE